MPNKKRVLQVLIACNITLVILHLLINHIIAVPSDQIQHWFDLDTEANIPTWFSSIQLFLIFVLAFTYAQIIQNRDLSKFYLFVCGVFLFFSIDETGGIHEGITQIMKKLSVQSALPGAHGLWIFIYPVILLALGFVFWKGALAFLNEKQGRAYFILGGFVFVAGGVGFELIGYFLTAAYGKGTVFHIIEVTAEESFEMLGQSLMIYGLLAKLYATNAIIFITENSSTNHKISEEKNEKRKAKKRIHLFE